MFSKRNFFKYENTTVHVIYNYVGDEIILSGGSNVFGLCTYFL